MALHDNLRLDHQLCFALYAATHAITRAYRGRLGELGLTYPQYLVLLALWDDASPKGLSVKSLADRLDLDSATVTPLLKRMQAAGLVTRERDPLDERALMVKPTAQAQMLRRQLSRAQREVADQTGLSAEELASLRVTLHRLSAQLNADDASPHIAARSA